MYALARWLFGPNLMTVFGPIFRPGPHVPLTRERWELSDGDFVDVDRMAGPRDAPLLLLLHGLEGSSSAHYIRGLLAQIIEDYTRQTGQKFDFTIGTTGQLRNIIATGQHADLIIASAPLMGELEKTGKMTPGSRADHYFGMSNCIPCHGREYAQWQTTAHSRAWKTLVDQHKESTPACVPCHVTGFVGPGGFQTSDDWARLGNVQCEACHGMGSQHNTWAKDGNRVVETTCRSCHTQTTSPTFRLADYRPHIVHDPPPGLRPLPETPAHRLMREGKSPHGQ